MSAPQKVGGLLDQWNLVRAAWRDKRLSRGDVAVLGETVQYHRSSHGNARISYAHLARETDMSRQAAIACMKRLVDYGYLTVGRLGVGTRPTEYIPIWLSGQADMTPTSGQVDLTRGVNPTLPLQPLVVMPALPHNLLTRGGLQAAVQESGNVPTTSPDPAPSGAAGELRDPFAELWSVYSRKYEIHRARTAYEKLAPDPELHARLVSTARAWAENYAAIGTEKKWQPTLANWLSAGRYDEDLPLKFENPKEAAIARSMTKKQQSAPPAITFIDDVGPFTPLGRHVARVVSYRDSDDEAAEEYAVTVGFKILDGDAVIGEFDHRMILEHGENTKTRGAKLFAELKRAIGARGLDMIGRRLVAVVGEDFSIEYRPAAANDNVVRGRVAA